MRLGLDIHGVIDKHPALYVEMATILHCHAIENEVHIITGHSITQALRDQLCSYESGFCPWWDHLVSIQDELLLRKATIVDYTYKDLEEGEERRPIFGDFMWDSFKGLYCAKNKIDLMIDDSIAYKRYFSTPFLLA